MKIKTSELTGKALDQAVMQCKGLFWKLHGHIPFSTDWAEGGLIIEQERIDVRWQPLQNGSFVWRTILADGSTPLIAAMRCYVALNLGDEVDVPDELMDVG
jgi:hypothetical protein